MPTDTAFDTTSARLRLATRIHFALLRRYGAEVGVGALLRAGPAAREALWVCAASDDAELVALGRRFDGLQANPAGTR